MLSKNFHRYEFTCNCGCGLDTVDVELIQIVQRIRDHFGKPVTINSGCRCEFWNTYHEGAMNSQHLLGRAADLVVKDTKPSDVYEFLCDEYPDRFGFGSYENFTHVDSRVAKARW